ncbi:Clavaminate synthase-like protein [Rhodofomes roseus]|uniref:Clavaminate synthase-like protein n=1 Tax=Rhodofomes roseus TaxID=34475 RepID=A0ABQ8JX86_9APHY|nr:Clavaminate synthase-like protein [Rhodofomes roseus]KAH9828690.1 Clavaminate synthase-like protein [Rhodofomes roseus]
MPGLTATAPFPDDAPIHPLPVIDYRLLKQWDRKEIIKLWGAATEQGFWYLVNHGVDREVNDMFDMGSETLDLPLQEKMRFEQGDNGNSFGYKAKGTIQTDANGTRDNVEFLNIAQDDALSWPKPTHRTYPYTVNARMSNTIIPFVHKSMDVNTTILTIFERQLGLPRGELLRLHSLESPCGSEARCIKTPQNQSTAGVGAHTDFGTLTFLHNRLGGLQVMPPGTQRWLYIKPLPGYAVCNIGDALSIFSGGILRSALHRVMPPPGTQSRFERYSIAFFTRPRNSVVLRHLGKSSDMIARAIAKAPEGEFETDTTSAEWVARRIRKLRLKNRQGPETWYASMGTEHIGRAISGA